LKTQQIKKAVLKLFKDFLILAFLGNFLTLLLFRLEFWTIQIFLNNCFMSILIGYPTWKGISFIDEVLDRKIPWLRQPLKRLLVQALSMTIYAALAMGSGMLIWVGLSEELTLSMMDSMVLNGLKYGLIFLGLSLLIGNTVLFFKNWKNSVIQQEELKRAHLALQFQTLKDQVKPHFLFNSLSSLVTLINTDTTKATDFVHRLSDVYRYLLEQRDNELVTVSEELQFLENYTFLQKIRFGENLQVHFDLKLNKNRMLLPLSLQMMVENAIKHNEVSSSHPLHIDIYSRYDQYIVIKNSLRKKSSESHSLGVGLENLKKRTSFFTDKPLEIEENSDSYTVSIPTITT